MSAQTTLQVVRAYDRAPIAELRTDDAPALDAKIERARALFADRANWLPIATRRAILQRVARAVEAEEATYAARIATEGGKPMLDAKVEVARAIDGLDGAAQAIGDLAGREVPLERTAAGAGRWAFTTHEPIGPVAAISAFNHPLNLIVHQVAPAVAAGCPVIIKPSSMTPLSCLALVDELARAGLPEGWCQTLVTADNALAERLACDRRIAFLTFIGSARVGWHLRARLAAGTRCALEHGGAAPVLVDQSADLAQAAAAVAKGGYYHAGQVCVSVQRIFVHQTVLGPFLAHLEEHVRTLRVGDPLLPETQVGPLIHPREVERVGAWVEEAAAGGAALIGGQRLGPTTYAPAILVGAPTSAKISQLEVFGPVVAVWPFSHLDEAIARANALPLAFQASVFSAALAPALRAAERLAASTVLINDHTAFRVDWMPFAGRRESGYGVGGISHTLREMCQEKMIVWRRDLWREA